ncbi:MAG: bifunctional lysine ketoglutarate reductase /saccharopine dehydrogenase family protein [Candidatus Krumholzibacteriota bacterium]
MTIGIRREDKNKWERRVPLVPADLAELAKDPNLDFTIQPSPIRVFPEDEYRKAGVTVDENLDEADIVVAVKEIPIGLLQEKKVYLYFSHTIKAQPYNMPMLKHLLDTGSTLIDYERIADEQNRRLIFFSIHAGYAGMIESLVGLARRMESNGVTTPFLELKHAYEYGSLIEARNHLLQIGDRIRSEGLGDHPDPIIIGLAGYGNVSRGCQEILDCLPITEITVDELEATAGAALPQAGPLVKVVFKEEDMVEPRSADAQFVLQDYYQRPENYRGVFEKFLPHLDVLMNTIYWEDRYPRLVTKKWAAAHYGPDKAPRLKVIGDISCDIEGSIELTLKAPMPDQPCFVYEAQTGKIHDGVVGDGPVIMAVDNLPCELPRESSEHFSSVLGPMVPALAQADFETNFEGLHLPPHLKKAVIAHRGELAPEYRYLQEAVDKVSG